MISSDKNTSNKLTLLIDLHYFPSIPYIKEFAKADCIVLEANETFQKQTYRNRCEILTANGKEALIVPVVHGSSGLIKDIKIDYSQRWFQIHERTLRGAYGKSPFFDFFMDDISAVFAQKTVYLWDFNYNLLTLCLEKLTLNKVITESNSYIMRDDLPDYVVDMRGKINPQSIKTEGQIVSKSYHQVFGNEFVTNLSVLDLLFCAVLDSTQILK